ncbi:MAG: response regulator [bacterium]|nr:response regulator [bacterium]
MNQPRHVLIVDDQADIRDLTRTLLEAEGYGVRVADCGERALDLLAERLADLVLLDINMPGMDGWQTLRMIRADDDMSAVKVVMFSVKGEMLDKVQGLQEGALDFITKPFAVDELIDRVTRVLE